MRRHSVLGWFFSAMTLCIADLPAQASSWRALHEGTTWVEADGGVVLLESESAGALRGIVPREAGTSTGRASLQVRFDSARDANRWMALVFRARGGSSPSYYLATMRHDPRGRSGLEIAVREDDAFRVLRRASWRGEWDASAWHELAVDVIAGRAAFQVDGELVLSTEWIDPQRLGTFGVVVSGARVALRNFAVEERAAPIAEPLVGPAPLLVAHRGASHDAPENTLASLRLAIEQGAAAIEFDVWATQDGVPVLSHDAGLARTTNWKARRAADVSFDVPGDVREATLAQLRTLDVGAWKGERWAGERIATLEEALEVLRGRSIAVIEIKDPTVVEAVARVVTKLGMEDAIQVISFHDEVVARVHELLPSVPTSLLVGGAIPARPSSSDALELLARTRRVHASTLSVNAAWVSEAFARTCRERGIALAVWTVDDPIAARALARLGVAAITSNRVPLVRSALTGATRAK